MGSRPFCRQVSAALILNEPLAMGGARASVSLMTDNPTCLMV